MAPFLQNYKPKTKINALVQCEFPFAQKLLLLLILSSLSTLPKL